MRPRAVSVPAFTYVLLTLSGILLAALLAACGGGEGPTEPSGDGDGDGQVSTVEVTPAADTLTALDQTRQLQATALDADGNEVTGVGFTWSSSDASVAAVDEGGVVTAEGNGAADITAAASGVTGTAEVAVLQRVETVSVSPGTATLTTVGATQQFTASATDANDNPVEGAIFVWDSEDPAVATVDPDGLATSKGSGTSTVTATSQDIPGFAEVTVNQEIDRLAFREQPTDAAAGEAIDPAVQVEVLDADGARVEDAEIAVTLALGTNPGGGSLAGTKTVNAVAGVATFSGMSVQAAATGYTLAASTPGTVSGAESAAFDVSAGPAAGVAFTVQPADAAAGAAMGPAVEVEIQDEFGNTATGATDEVTVELASGPAEADLLGTTTVSASGGVATLDDPSVEVAETGSRLRAEADGLDPELSRRFEITPAAAAQLAFVGQPHDTEGREPINDPVQVAVRDAFGNRVTGSAASVTVALGADPTGGDATLSGTTTVSASSGVATFADLSVARPGSGYALEATSAGVSTGTSEAFGIHLTFVQVDAGHSHSCGVTVAGWAYCWGDSFGSGLGDGGSTDRTTPVPVASTETFAQISAGGFYACGVSTDDVAYCWGLNNNGELGDGSMTERPTPVAVDVSGLTTQTFAMVSAGVDHTCGLTTADEVFCWGDNAQGQLGDGNDPQDSDTPVAVDVSALATQTFADVSAWGNHTCGVTTADEAFCWGANADGQLGDGNDPVNSSTPVEVDVSGLSTQTFVQVDVGSGQSCGVTTADEAFCWGNNADGVLGDGGTTPSSTPVRVEGFRSFVVVGTGSRSSCGVTESGDPFCWGDNSFGRLGDGTGLDSPSPVRVLITEPLESVDVGTSHTCALTAEDGPYCWGRNSSGQLGDGTKTDRLSPVPVATR